MNIGWNPGAYPAAGMMGARFGKPEEEEEKVEIPKKLRMKGSTGPTVDFLQELSGCADKSPPKMKELIQDGIDSYVKDATRKNSKQSS